ncbi:MAG: hypothetical protein CMO66_02490 [Verrucomicrobiales bacterium]|nr:hypothetical protein [Verrucomicrobiales bacterium]
MNTTRRTFLHGMAGSAVATPLLAQNKHRSYDKPNVVIVRFGGGCRRMESIDPQKTYAPYLRKTLAPRGVLFENMLIDSLKPHQKVDTSHGQGTIYILTGSYNKLGNAGGKGLDLRFVPNAPTVFEYLRKEYDIADHETLVINSEDRKQEEFLTYSNHLKYGINYRCQILSLYRFKRFLYPQLLDSKKRDGKPLPPQQLRKIRNEYNKLVAIDQRQPLPANPKLEGFWSRWRDHYGESGFKNPRGDRLLTELAVRAMCDPQLRPRLMMVNYTDCDYVHWGIRSHYYNAISIMDQGLRRLVSTADTAEGYRDNTIFVIVPDCGRDNNPLADVPFQHHFNSRSSHEIFCLIFGKGVPTKTRIATPVDQSQIAATIGGHMGFTANQASAPLQQAFA